MTNEKEIYKIIKMIKTDKNPGYGGIRPIDLKTNAEIFIIKGLINQSLEEGQIPQILKTMIIRPIYKKGEKKNFKN